MGVASARSLHLVGTLHPWITSSVCTRYREMLVIEKTTPDKEGSLALGTFIGNKRSDRAHIPGHPGIKEFKFVVHF